MKNSLNYCIRKNHPNWAMLTESKFLQVLILVPQKKRMRVCVLIFHRFSLYFSSSVFIRTLSVCFCFLLFSFSSPVSVAFLPYTVSTVCIIWDRYSDSGEEVESECEHTYGYSFCPVVTHSSCCCCCCWWWCVFILKRDSYRKQERRKK